MADGKKQQRPGAQRSRGPNDVDAYLARRIRMLRDSAGLSQAGLAAGIGVSPQQVEKYESAASRISASRLYAVASALNVSISLFFPESPEITSGGSNSTAPDPSSRADRYREEARRAHREAADIRLPQLRQQLLSIARQYETLAAIVARQSSTH